MRNLGITSPLNAPWARWFVGAAAFAGCLAAVLYVVSPSLGRAVTRNSFPSTTGLGGSPGIPGGVPLLW